MPRIHPGLKAQQRAATSDLLISKDCTLRPVVSKARGAQVSAGSQGRSRAVSYSIAWPTEIGVSNGVVVYDE